MLLMSKAELDKEIVDAVAAEDVQAAEEDDDKGVVVVGQQQQEETEAAKRAGLVTLLGKDDCLMGRGAPSAEYQGNARLRQIVLDRREEYVGARKRKDKHRIAVEIIATVHSRKGRFLRRVEDAEVLEKAGLPSSTAAWQVVTDRNELLSKVKQLLRDIGPEAKVKRAARRQERKRLRDVWPKPHHSAESKGESEGMTGLDSSEEGKAGSTGPVLSASSPMLSAAASAQPPAVVPSSSRSRTTPSLMYYASLPFAQRQQRELQLPQVPSLYAAAAAAPMPAAMNAASPLPLQQQQQQGARALLATAWRESTPTSSPPLPFAPSSYAAAAAAHRIPSALMYPHATASAQSLPLSQYHAQALLHAQQQQAAAGLPPSLASVQGSALVGGRNPAACLPPSSLWEQWLLREQQQLRQEIMYLQEQQRQTEAAAAAVRSGTRTSSGPHPPPPSQGLLHQAMALHQRRGGGGSSVTAAALAPVSSSQLLSTSISSSGGRRSRSSGSNCCTEPAQAQEKEGEQHQDDNAE